MIKRIIAMSTAAVLVGVLLASCTPKPTGQNTSGAVSQTAVSVIQGTSQTVSGGVTSAGVTTSGGATTTSGSGKTSGGGTDAKDIVDGASNLIRIWWPQNDESMLAAASQYEKKKPGVKFNITTPADYTVEALKVAITGKKEPDVVWLDHVYITALGKQKQILDLRKYGAAKEAGQYLKSCWDGVSFNGNVYGLPHDGNTIALMYNKTVFDKVNAKPPQTYDGIISAGKLIKSKSPGTTPFTSPFFDTNSQGRLNWSAFVYFFWLWRCGGEVLNSSDTKAAFNSKAGEDALNKLTAMVKTHNICEGTKYMEGEFYDGQVGMIEMGNWSLPRLQAADRNANFGVYMMPELKKGVPRYSGLGLYALGITARCKNPKLTYDFLRFYTTDSGFQIQYGKQHNQLPVTKKALSDKFYQSNGFWKLYVDQYALSRSRPGVESWDQIEKEVALAVNSAVKGDKTPAAALDGAAVKVNALLK